MAPFWQGAESHSFISSWQYEPVYPSMQWQRWELPMSSHEPLLHKYLAGTPEMHKKASILNIENTVLKRKFHLRSQVPKKREIAEA